MRNAWVNIRRVYESRHVANQFMEVMMAKFPNVKFRLGKSLYHTDTGEHVAVQALLPTPHPNEESRVVVQYARSLEVKVSWEPTYEAAAT